MPYVITGYVRRGGGREPQKSCWDGSSWTRDKLKVYPTHAAAKRAADSMDVRLIDSVCIQPVHCDTCGGSGRRSTARSASGRELERHEKHGTPCDSCGGSGNAR